LLEVEVFPMASPTLSRPRMGSEAVTDGIRITVQPSYSSLDSDPANNYFKFVYRIRIRNESDDAVCLLSRHWIIVDADGERQEVRGEGVVGQQPVIVPGQTFEYASFCPLPTSWGTMEGEYVMRRIHADGSSSPDFVARVARFFLVCPPDPVDAI
jgi:ApaG protein